jgi:hypothetical protein
MSPLRRLALVSTSLGMVAASALTVSTATSASAATAASSASAAPPTVHVFVSGDHTLKMPKRLRPGMHRFVIESERDAAFQLATAAPGYTKAEAMRDVFRGLDRGNVRAIKRFEANVTLFGGAASTADQAGMMWESLPAGRYWALDTNARRTLPRNVLTVKVAGRQLTGHVRSAAKIRAINETDWARQPRSIPSQGRLTFRNDAEDNHFLILAKLAPGKTMKDFAAWVKKAANGGQAPPPLDFSAPGLDTGVISPGHRMVVKYDLQPGRYAMLCFWPDADMGGMPHVFMGMYRGIRLR